MNKINKVMNKLWINNKISSKRKILKNKKKVNKKIKYNNRSNLIIILIKTKTMK